MITITAEQIERVNLILSGVPGGIEKALSSTIRRANNTVRSETLKGITTVYAITRQNVRAETTIKVRTQSSDGGIVGTVLFAGHKIRWNTNGNGHRLLFVESKGGKRCENQKGEPGGNGGNAR